MAHLGPMLQRSNVRLCCKPRKQAGRPDRDALRSVGACQNQPRVRGPHARKSLSRLLFLARWRDVRVSWRIRQFDDDLGAGSQGCRKCGLRERAGRACTDL